MIMDVFKEKCNDLDIMNNVDRMPDTVNNQESIEKKRLESLKKEIHDLMNKHITETKEGLDSVEEQQKSFYKSAKGIPESIVLDIGPEIPNDPTAKPSREIMGRAKKTLQGLLGNSRGKDKGVSEVFIDKYKEVAYLSEEFFTNPSKRSETLSAIKSRYEEVYKWIMLDLEIHNNKRASVVGVIKYAKDEMGVVNRSNFDETVIKRDASLISNWTRTQAYTLLSKIKRQEEDLEDKGERIKNDGKELKDNFSGKSKILIKRMEEYLYSDKEKSE